MKQRYTIGDERSTTALVTSGVIVVDDLLQRIADAWNEVDPVQRHQIRTAAGKLVAAIEDALEGIDE